MFVKALLVVVLRRMLLILTSLFCFLPLAAMPIQDGGIFRETEFVNVFIFYISVFAFLIFVILSLFRETLEFPLKKIIGLGLIVLVGCAGYFFNVDFSRSMLGTLEQEVGVLWYVFMGAWIVIAYNLWNHSNSYKIVLSISSSLSVVVCMILTFLNMKIDGNLAVPYEFREYIGVNAVFASVALMALNGRIWRILAGLFIVSAIVFSGNRSMFLVLMVFFSLVIISRFGFRFKSEKIFVIGSVVVFTVALLSAPIFQYSATYGKSISEFNDHVLSDKVLDHVELQNKSYGTLWSRSILVNVVVKYLVDNPSKLLTGDGFGYFEAVSNIESRYVPGRKMVKEYDTASKTYWDGEHKAKFNSHNIVAEMLLSVGIIGLIGWLLFGWSTVSGRTDDDKYWARVLLSVSLSVGLGLWFFVNSALPVMALAFAVSFDDGEKTGKTGREVVGMLMSILMPVALSLSVLSYAAFKGEKMERIFFPLFSLPNGGVACEGFETLFMQNREANRKLYSLLMKYFNEKSAEGNGILLEEIKKRHVNIMNYSCMMRKDFEEKGDVLSLFESLKNRSELVVLLKNDRQIENTLMYVDNENWKKDLLKLLERAPGRTDLIIGYVKWAEVTKGSGFAIKEINDFTGKIVDGDPVKLYLEAERERMGGNLGKAKEYMKSSLKAGLANLMVVEYDFVKDVME